jgi:hypothetical protein
LFLISQIIKMKKIYNTLTITAIITISLFITGLASAAVICESATRIECGANQEKISITTTDVDGQECETYACADACPPQQLQNEPYYFCNPESAKTAPDVPADKESNYSSYTCVNYTCVGLESTLPKIEGINISSFETYLSYIYQIGLGIVGITALLVIIYSGVLYITSAGNASQMGEAKDRIKSAILGLILALAAYLILYTINPDLVKLTKVQIQYPKMPRVILECDETKNICESRVVKLGDEDYNSLDTCGKIGTACPPRCSITNAYWSKQETKAGEDVSLIVEAKGNCDDIKHPYIQIYEDNWLSDKKIDEFDAGNFEKGSLYHTMVVEWTVKEPSSSWWNAVKSALNVAGSLLEGKLDYVFEINLVEEDKDKNWIQSSKESGILKVDTGS